MFIILICILICTFTFTLLGGWLALELKQHLYLVVAFSGGAVSGVAFFDLLPAAITQSSQLYSAQTITAVAGLGFVFYLIVDRSLLALQRQSDILSISFRGKVQALCMTFHSLLDGIAIGVAFQVSASLGFIVAVAVLSHDLIDGISTVNIILKENGSKMQAIKWALVNAVTPVIGALSTYFYQIPPNLVGLILALLSGCFIYIGASNFLPESQHKQPRILTTGLSVLGFVLLFLIINYSGI